MRRAACPSCRRLGHSPRRRSQNRLPLFRIQITYVVSGCTCLIIQYGENAPLLPETPSCSWIFERSEPPTKPMATCLRRSRRRCIISGDADYIALELADSILISRGHPAYASSRRKCPIYVEKYELLMLAVGEIGRNHSSS